MTETIKLNVNGVAVEAGEGATVLTALVNAGILACRTSVSGYPRGALCGMGVCFECRVTVDGVRQRRACATICHEGMEVRTDDNR